MKTDKIMIVDGNSILNRAFYGLQGTRMLSTKDGLHTNAIYGFLNILIKYINERNPQYLCVAFDLKAPTFRHLEFSGYKAKRQAMPEELAEQVPVMKQILDAMNIKRLEMEGYEADDLIGCISRKAEEQGLEVLIVTGDRDSLQLASARTKILLPVTKFGKTETEEYDEQGVIERYGVTPTQFIDVKGLMGDQSDNIPGVPGIGEKTAIALIQAFGSIENIYDNLDRINKKSVREKLEANRELAFLSKRLATITRNMDNLCSIEELKIKEYDRPKLYEIFRRLEFRSFIEKFGLDESYPEAGVGEPEKIDVVLVDDVFNLARVASEIKQAGGASIFYLLERKNSFESRLAGLALSWNGGNAYIKIGEGISEEQFLQQFGPVFSDSEVKFCGHDLKSLIVYLKWKGILFCGLSFDTMIGAYILNPTGSTYTVSELAAEYLNYSIEPIEKLRGKGKSQLPYSQIPQDLLSQAAVRHSLAITRLKDVIGKRIEENGQEELYYEIELPLVEVLADMEYRGIKVDIQKLKEYSRLLDEKIIESEQKIYELAGETFNINSPKQLGVILFEKLRLPPVKKTKTGYSTDAEVIDQLARMHPAVAEILHYRQLVKLKTTYAQGLLSLVNPKTGRIHSSFNQTVTATGRISSTEPNLQNIPVKVEMGREIRKVFVPENEEYVLCDADYSQIELRVLAHITGDENMIEAFRNNEDIHTATASAVFKVPPDEVTPMLRSRAKAVNFGIVYGISDFSLAKDIGISRKEARRYIDQYLERYPGVKRYMHDTVEFGKKYGFVETMFKRRRYLPELSSSNFNTRAFGERVALNMPIQGTAADIIKIAMVKVYKELTSHKMKSGLILQVHDELVIETHISEKERVEEILRSCMQEAVKLDVPLIADVKTGSNWYETK